MFFFKYLIFFSSLCFFFAPLGELLAQVKEPDAGIFKAPPKPPKDSIKGWAIGGGLGLDFGQLILINPRPGVGENRIGIGGNSSFYARYLKGRWLWLNQARMQLAVQRLGRGNKPFQKNLDELRVTSSAYYALTDKENSPFSYAIDLLFVSQLTPTYIGNLLSVRDTLGDQYPIARFFAPATLNFAPGLAYKPKENFAILVAPASIKMIMVGDDSIARRTAAGGGGSLHGNPYGRFASEEAFRREWTVRPKRINDSTFYANTAFQFGATLKVSYSKQFFKNWEDKPLLGIQSALLLYSNYLRDPQNIDVDWTTTIDLSLIRGLTLSLNINLFYDHDVFVLLDRDNDINTGVNGYESTGRRVSFTQSLILKYNVLF